MGLDDAVNRMQAAADANLDVKARQLDAVEQATAHAWGLIAEFVARAATIVAPKPITYVQGTYKSFGRYVKHTVTLPEQGWFVSFSISARTMRPDATGLGLFAVTTSGVLYENAYMGPSDPSIRIWGGKVGGVFGERETPEAFRREQLRYRLGNLKSESGEVLKYGLEDSLGLWFANRGIVNLQDLRMSLEEA